VHIQTKGLYVRTRSRPSSNEVRDSNRISSNEVRDSSPSTKTRPAPRAPGRSYAKRKIASRPCWDCGLLELLEVDRRGITGGLRARRGRGSDRRYHGWGR
jgi:hypothetical protein